MGSGKKEQSEIGTKAKKMPTWEQGKMEIEIAKIKASKVM
jgi:hypothetical protein